MIHHDDPNHPVTTTLQYTRTPLVLSVFVLTDIDVLSFNIFGSINFFERDLKRLSWFWRGPYMLTEWGIDGPWEGTKATSWGAHIETSSNIKSEQYLMRYEKAMPVTDGRFLGSFAFYWGKKQETTHTWFSMFNDKGAKTQVVSILKYIWSGKKPKKQPEIHYLTINGRSDDIIMNSNQLVNANIVLSEQSTTIKKIQWEIYPEDWYKKNNRPNIIKPELLQSYNRSPDNLDLSFTSPQKPGPYRLFVTIYDNDEDITTCNTPFYVVKYE
jgi:hypothetical protein